MNKKSLFAIIAIALLSLPAQARHKKSQFADEVAEAVDEATIKAPIADEVCFSPEGHCDIKLTKFVASAQKSIDIAIFDINLDHLVHEILLQSKKITVRVVVDRREAKGKNSLVPLLRKAGVQIRYGHQRGIMHNKFVVVDDKIIETGSFNYTNGAAFRNNENQVYLATPAIVGHYKDRFEKLWAEADLIK